MSGRSVRSAAAALVVAWPLLALAACRRDELARVPPTQPSAAGQDIRARDSMLADLLIASGIAAPRQEAQLASKLGGTVTAVAVAEGARVAAGALIARLDARDVEARGVQVEAGIQGAEAAQVEAAAQAERMRGLRRDSAATPAQLDAAESALARATAAAAAARAGLSEWRALRSYAEIRAPFAGQVTRRFVDPGAFIAPGMPIATVQDVRVLRISAAIEPRVAQGLHVGQRLTARIEGVAVEAAIEGIVPAAAALYTVNALVDNRDARFLSGSAAVLELPQAPRRMVLVPTASLQREGELVGVRVRNASGVVVRWVRVGRAVGADTEVLAGLAAGDPLLLPGRVP